MALSIEFSNLSIRIKADGTVDVSTGGIEFCSCDKTATGEANKQPRTGRLKGYAIDPTKTLDKIATEITAAIKTQEGI